MKRKQGVLLLGATGSIGTSTVRVLKNLNDRFYTVGVVAHSSLGKLAEAAVELHASYAVTTDEKREKELASLLENSGVTGCGGMEKVCELAASPEVDVVVVAIVGTAGLLPALAALRAGKRVALASKEVMVMAGEIVNRELDAGHGSIVPVDSEHSAIFQCLQGRRSDEVKNLVLTASGGAFRDWNKEDLVKATVKDALRHPTWSMGAKITVDSASLMNKALELVEAHYLFRTGADQLKVVIHPQSIIHSMIELQDHTLIAQLAKADMRFAIQYALTYPERCGGELPELDFSTLASLTFQTPDRVKYPSLDFGFQALREGGTLSTVMNAANEVAVQAFFTEKIRFTTIWDVVEKTMAAHRNSPQDSLEQLQEADRWARSYAGGLIP